MWELGMFVSGMAPALLLACAPYDWDPRANVNCANHSPGSQVPGAGLHACGAHGVSPCSRSLLLLFTALPGLGALPCPGPEAWAQNDVFPHLKATGVFMRPSRGERHYMCEAGGMTAAGQREPAAYPGADATLS